MMQAKHNESDPITLASALEFYSTLLTLAYLKAKTGCEIVIESSHNQRASQPAQALAQASQSELTYKNCWDCVNYPKDEALDREQLNKGALAWNKKNVDAVIGEGTYQRISDDVQQQLQIPRPEQQLTVVFTHTQQTNAICQSLNLDIVRLKNYGFIAIPNNHPASLHANGIYHPQKTLKEATTTNWQFFLPQNTTKKPDTPLSPKQCTQGATQQNK